MVKKLGGTRAILAYGFALAFIGGCFASGVSDIKFTALATMTTTVVMHYFSNKATKDKPAE